MGKIEVIKPGIYSSIQDAGRVGYGHFGIPKSGAMDQLSFQRANALLGNKLNLPALEITFSGPVLRFAQSTRIAICGADLDLELNGSIVRNDSVIEIPQNAVLKIGHCYQGTRAYLAIAGGFNVPKTFGSASWSRGVSEQIRLNKGDSLSFHDGKDIMPMHMEATREKQSRGRTINSGDQDSIALGKVGTGLLEEKTNLQEDAFGVWPGPEFSWLSEPQQIEIFEKPYKLLPSSDRMAFSFSATPLLPFSTLPFLTSGVKPGVVQWYPNGQLVLLHRDAQRTGGYPRVAIFSSKSLNEIAQLPIGEPFYLKNLNT